jgi:ATP sulfurylase
MSNLLSTVSNTNFQIRNCLKNWEFQEKVYGKKGKSMASSKRNNALYIDTEALSTLALVQAGLISPVNKLMNREEANSVDETKIYKGVPFPFAFVLAPNGKKNATVLKKLQKGDVVDLINAKKKVGAIKLRPWLQYFRDYTQIKHPYTKKEIQAQIQAANDANVSGWMFWSPSSKYNPSFFKQLSIEK